VAKLVPVEPIDYAEVYLRGGANQGDEDFAPLRCRHCRWVYLLKHEVDTLYVDLSRRLPVYNEGFTCTSCGRLIPGDEPRVAEGPGWSSGPP